MSLYLCNKRCPHLYVIKNVPKGYLLWDIPSLSVLGYSNLTFRDCYVIKDVPTKRYSNVTTDDTFCDHCNVITCVPDKIWERLPKRQISISQKSVPPYGLIIDISIKNVSKWVVGSRKPDKNGIDRLKLRIFYDYRFKTQHQYDSHTKWYSFRNDKDFESFLRDCRFEIYCLFHPQKITLTYPIILSSKWCERYTVILIWQEIWLSFRK